MARTSALRRSGERVGAKRVSALAPEAIQQLDPGIRLTVAWLRAVGYETTDSGDGVTKAEWIGSGEAMPFPHVIALVPPLAMASQAQRLSSLLKSLGFAVDPVPPEPGVTIAVHAYYDVGANVAIVELDGVNDAMLLASPLWVSRFDAAGPKNMPPT